MPSGPLAADFILHNADVDCTRWATLRPTALKVVAVVVVAVVVAVVEVAVVPAATSSATNAIRLHTLVCWT